MTSSVLSMTRCVRKISEFNTYKKMASGFRTPFSFEQPLVW